MYGGAYETKTPCFATIALDAKRFSLDGDNDHENALRFHVMNKKMLEALRSALVQVFNEAYDSFLEGRRLLSNPDIPALPTIIKAIQARAALWGRNARADRGDAASLEGTPEYVRSLALTAYKALYHKKSIPISRLSLTRLLKEAGGVDLISRLAEPAADALMAAATIVQIDTGWEASTVLNMDLNPFVGTVKKNSIIVRAVVSRKKRAGGKLRNAALIDIDGSDEEPDKDVAIPLKQKGLKTAYQIIIAYREMTAHIRDSLGGKSKSKLWICRSSRPVNENVYDAFVRFLAKNEHDPLLGRLPLTRRSIKRTKFNVDAGATQGNIPLAQARGDHSDLRTSIAYLSAPAVRALFQHKLREYLNQLDVMIYHGVDDLAVKLGISEHDLHRRKALGIENGLTELLSETALPPSAPEKLSEELNNLNPSDDALRSLCLAGEALEARWEEMAAKNPARFLRAWVPWMAVVQALATKILNGRHRIKFKTVLKRVRSELALGQTLMPAIW
ncbi:hypothetical protein [Rhizobium leguminosarum]|uniref:hypothetical protein n=1 Tax=Rhizobium leguminosarum TaxID=384 RepID=UPI00102F9BEE|nr:hypothetical protein [Rhizobium leguminosarum]TAX29830.1 hypothetical protein ELI04_08685 [Rhizobium leguminosarum]